MKVGCDGESILFVNIVALGISNEFIGFADQSRDHHHKLRDFQHSRELTLLLTKIIFDFDIYLHIFYTDTCRINVIFNIFLLAHRIPLSISIG